MPSTRTPQHSTKNLTRVVTWVAAALPVMRLGHWTIRVHRTPHSDGVDAFAAIQCQEAYCIAEITLDGAFFTQAEDAQRATIAHELAHIYTWRSGNVFDRVNREGKAVLRKERRAAYSDGEEYATETVSRALLPLLPPWPRAMKATSQRRR